MVNGKFFHMPVLNVIRMGSTYRATLFNEQKTLYNALAGKIIFCSNGVYDKRFLSAFSAEPCVIIASNASPLSCLLNEHIKSLSHFWNKDSRNRVILTRSVCFSARTSYIARPIFIVISIRSFYRENDVYTIGYQFETRRSARTLSQCTSRIG